jgi:hypothetical protein
MTQAFGLGCDVAGPSALNKGQESTHDLSVERARISPFLTYLPLVERS